MKQVEENKTAGIISVFDMAEFFDKESLLDCMNTLNKKAKIDANQTECGLNSMKTLKYLLKRQ